MDEIRHPILSNPRNDIYELWVFGNAEDRTHYLRVHMLVSLNIHEGGFTEIVQLKQTFGEHRNIVYRLLVFAVEHGLAAELMEFDEFPKHELDIVLDSYYGLSEAVFH